MNAEGVTITVDVIMHPHSTINPESFMRVNFCNKNFRTTTLPMKIFLHLIFSSIQSKIPMLGRKQCSDARSPTQLPQQILLAVQDIHWSPLTSHNYLQFQCLRRLSTINLTKSGSDSSNNVQSYQFSSGLNFTLFFVKRVPQYPATVLIYQCWLHL